MDLLSEICTEEEYKTLWLKLSASVRNVSTDPDADGQAKDIHTLKKEIRELKSLVAALEQKLVQAFALHLQYLADTYPE